MTLPSDLPSLALFISILAITATTLRLAHSLGAFA